MTTTGQSKMDQSKPQGREMRWLIGVDCDGVLTDYKNYFGPEGRLFKVFNSKDSYAFSDLLKAGHIIYVISADKDGFSLLESRARSWKVQAFTSKDKRKTLQEVMASHQGEFDKVCFVGNGREDLVVMDLVDAFYAPADARPDVLLHPKAHKLSLHGGEGVMDEVSELLRSYS